MSQAAPQLTLGSQTRTLLSRYALAPRVLNALSGERLAREAGQSLEFFDVRPYGTGDELRYVDWKAYARTGKLVTRLFQAERTSALHVLLDTSASMAVVAIAMTLLILPLMESIADVAASDLSAAQLLFARMLGVRESRR